MKTKEMDLAILLECEKCDGAMCANSYSNSHISLYCVDCGYVVDGVPRFMTVVNKQKECYRLRTGLPCIEIYQVIKCPHSDTCTEKEEYNK